ncbi:RNA polymerase factor sigma-32 [Sandaracinus amylolyticus]|uniref:RNA polymerase factor sigma-32 n=1 Tax=Sandaracinus amylolyticus TaxID=927083 RepID=UPI001F1B3B7E|nr:RNA polymerase factor sigma-32 [Sandaracinus amylolyticus]UJR80131.1 RNA polymerase sigma factor RpoH [Sandaracinus amylolyticus]
MARKTTKAKERSEEENESEVLAGEVVDEREEARDDDDEGSEAEQESRDDDEALEGDVVVEGEVVDDVDLAEPIPARAETGSALATQDPLQAYMRDVQRYSLLTPEQTHELAVKYVETGDVDAARKLVTSNLRLVVKIAYDYRRAYRNILDLIQEGNIGLMQAVKKYDPYRGVKLSSYAAWWIRAYILRFILNNWRLVKLGTTQAQRKLFFNLKKEKARLSAMGIDPTPEVVAKNLDVTTDDVVQMDRRLGAGELSLDAPIGHADGKPTSRIDTMAALDSPADELLASAELEDLLTGKIREFGQTLKGKEDVIFRERLMSDEPKTLQELGEQFGVSRERVRQIEKRLQGKIRAYLEQHVEASALPS